MSDAPTFETILYATDGPIATVTLNRPERKNAIGPAMANELLHAFARATDDAKALLWPNGGSN